MMSKAFRGIIAGSLAFGCFIGIAMFSGCRDPYHTDPVEWGEPDAPEREPLVAPETEAPDEPDAGAPEQPIFIEP